MGSGGPGYWLSRTCHGCPGQIVAQEELADMGNIGRLYGIVT